MIGILVAFLLADQPANAVDWKSLVPAIEATLSRTPGFGYGDGGYPVGITETVDITGDGVPEALVFIGAGGAYSNALVVMRFVNRRPLLARFKARDGKVRVETFLRGASVMHTVGVDLFPQNHAVFSYHYDYNSPPEGEAQKIVECGGEAYRWNARTRLFEYSKELSDNMAAELCRKVRKE
jgi:hypothetical protein